MTAQETRDLPVLTPGDWCTVNGKRLATFPNSIGTTNPDLLRGTEVIIDGKIETVIAVETFCIGRKPGGYYPENLAYGLLLDG